MTILAQYGSSFCQGVTKNCDRARVRRERVSRKIVRAILKAVEGGGDRAVLRYTKKFDRLSLKLEQMRVTPEEIKEAYYHIRKDEGDCTPVCRCNGSPQFHERQRTKTWMYQEQPATLGQMVTPLDAVGVLCARWQSRLSFVGADVRDSCESGRRSSASSCARRRRKGRSIPIFWWPRILPVSMKFIGSAACKRSAPWRSARRLSRRSTKLWVREYLCGDGEAPALWHRRHRHGGRTQ